jgi:hypothetical protein
VQASLRLAEDGQIAMRARLLEAERRAGAGAQLRADNADLARQAAALRGEREAAQRRSDALQLEIDVLQACASISADIHSLQQPSRFVMVHWCSPALHPRVRDRNGIVQL